MFLGLLVWLIGFFFCFVYWKDGFNVVKGGDERKIEVKNINIVVNGREEKGVL